MKHSLGIFISIAAAAPAVLAAIFVVILIIVGGISHFHGAN